MLALDATSEFDFNYDYWVCSRCSFPTRLVFEGMTDGMFVQRGASALLSFDGHANGTATLTWAMPDGSKVQTMIYKPYPRKVDMDQGRNILVECWRKLDVLITDIRSGTDIHLEYHKAQANMLADVLALMMPTYYEDATAVLRESMRRWEARQENREHDTPGLAESIWDPTVRKGEAPWLRSGGAVRVPVKLDEQKTNFVKHSLANEILTPEKLAEMFGCTVDDIKAANDS